MPDLNDLVDEAQRFLGPASRVQAAGVLGLKDSYVALTAGSLAGSLLTLPGADPAAGALAGVAGMRTAREARARTQGLSVRMLVAVTSTGVYLLEIGPVGITPTREALTLDRSTLAVGVKRFGLSRRITLDDGHHRVELTGAVSPLSPYTAGTRALLGALV